VTPNRPAKEGSGGVPDAVRRAVERTFQSTLGSAETTRERAQDMVDEVLRLAEEGASRAGRGVRGARQRPAVAAAGMGDRLRDAIGELRFATRDEVRALRSEIRKLERRVDALESKAPERRRKTGA
jgi:polyhydroxyalkanoate synthesis regulator phasin